MLLLIKVQIFKKFNERTMKTSPRKYYANMQKSESYCKQKN